ncbi:coatomer subunit gamma [Ascosphaera pollenicola]|nr:coatomer subunit gamma [Ascosphaera pollenicola]
MSHLTGLVLPPSLAIHSDEDMALDVEWPSNLSYLSIGLTFLVEPGRRAEAGFSWPLALRHLIISGKASEHWMDDFASLLNPFPPFSHVLTLELVATRTPSLRARHLEAPTNPTDNSTGAWMIIRKFPNLKSLAMPSNQCDEHFMSAYCKCEPVSLEHLHLFHIEGGLRFGTETLYEATTHGIRNLRGFWYQYNDAGIEENVLESYDEALDGVFAGKNDITYESMADSGWFDVIDTPYRPREFRYETWY